ncbi:MAG TPA: pyridoxal phosphate-dependent aminotransferase [Pseudomonadales bacterium]|nr:pyridoxal phosphate-dependent aminotransferase [Pseudomonadales bacterium]
MSQHRYADRLDDIQPFRVMGLLARANELAAAGHDVVHMEVGEPDFPTPEPIVRAGMAALRDGLTKYTPAQGVPALRDTIANFYRTDYGLDIDPARIIVTAGGSGALLLASALLINSGEGLLMADPGYPCNRHFLRAFEGEGQLVPVTPNDLYQLSGQLVRDAWRENTRGVLVASPANPTGAILSEQALGDIAAEVESRNGFLVVDEIYHGLCYSPDKITSALSVDDGAFIVNSFSKYFGMTGWRLGWLVIPEDAALEVEKLAQNLFICPSSIAQHAALAAFTPAAREIMDGQREQFKARRDFLVPALREIGFGVPVTPEGAFYVYAQIPAGCDDAEKFCRRLLEEKYVAVTPGTDFGSYLARDHVRFSYAQELSLLEKAVERIGAAVREWGAR